MVNRGRGCTGPGCGPGGGYGRGGRGHGRHFNMEGHFRKHGFRLTVPRQIILEILEENEEFLAAEDLYMQVHERHPGIGLATVYRTLQLLVEIGVVSRIETGEGKARFKLAGAKGKGRRELLICTNCFKTVPLDTLPGDHEQLLERLEKNIEAANGFQVRQSALHLYGLCSECARQDTRSGDSRYQAER